MSAGGSSCGATYCCNVEDSALGGPVISGRTTAGCGRACRFIATDSFAGEEPAIAVGVMKTPCSPCRLGLLYLLQSHFLKRDLYALTLTIKASAKVKAKGQARQEEDTHDARNPCSSCMILMVSSRVFPWIL